MSNSIVASQGLATVTLTAGQSIALNSLTETTVFEQVGFPNYPSQNDLEATFTGYDVLGPYASGATLVIEAGAAPVAYQVGTQSKYSPTSNCAARSMSAPLGNSTAMVAPVVWVVVIRPDITLAVVNVAAEFCVVGVAW